MWERVGRTVGMGKIKSMKTWKKENGKIWKKIKILKNMWLGNIRKIGSMGNVKNMNWENIGKSGSMGNMENMNWENIRKIGNIENLENLKDDNRNKWESIVGGDKCKNPKSYTMV